jgi:hypothetical protein
MKILMPRPEPQSKTILELIFSASIVHLPIRLCPRLTKTCRDKGQHAVEKERDVANLVLFLCTKEGEGVSGVMVGTDGNVSAL